MKNYILIICLILGFISCSQKGDEGMVVLDDNLEKIKGGQITTIDDDNGVYTISLIDSMIILQDRANENIFHFYSTNDYRKNFAFGQEGEGPENFSSMPQIIQSSIKYHKGDGFGFTLFDVNKRVIKKFMLNDILDKNYLPRETLRIDAKLLGGFQLNFLSDRKVIGKDHLNGEGNFFIYDEDQGKKKWIDFYPELQIEPVKGKKAVAYDSFIDVCESEGLIIQAMKFFNRLNFYDLNGNLKKSVLIGEEVIPDFSKEGTHVIPQDVIYFAMDMYVSDKFVYLLYANMEVGEIFVENGNNSPFKILKFDMEGKFLNEFYLDRQLLCFVVDENESAFGLSFQEGVVRLIKYSL